MNAPSTATTPPIIHAATMSAEEPTLRATVAGVTKMPEPTMPPITIMVASKRPTRRASE